MYGIFRSCYIHKQSIKEKEKNIMAKFVVCPDCGATLDHGEKCDCNVSAESAIEALHESAQQFSNDI
jgi:hypothetical protein